MAEPQLQAAAAAFGLGQPSLALELIRDWRKRQTAKTTIRLLRETGFPLDNPAGVVLSALLESGAVSTEEAFGVYMQIRQAQAADLQIALRMTQIEEAALKNRALLARTMRIETQNLNDLASMLYDDRIKAIDQELEEVRTTKRQLAELGQLDLPALKDLEARERALKMNRMILVEKKRRFIFNGANALRQGKFVTPSAPEIIAKEYEREQNLIRLAQLDNADAYAKLEVDDAFIQYAEATALIDYGQAFEKSGQSVEEATEDAKRNYFYFIRYLNDYVGPGYAVYFDRAYRKQMGPLLYSNTVEATETEEGMSLWEALLGAGAVGVIGGGAWAVFKRFMRRRAAGRGPVGKVVEEAKKRAGSVKVKTDITQIEVKNVRAKRKKKSTKGTSGRKRRRKR